MGKRSTTSESSSADALDSIQTGQDTRPSKMAKKNLFDEVDSGSSSSPEEEVQGQGLRINEEYARRFEHNKKREERHRLEEKYKAQPGNGEDDDESESSDDETEDEEGFLATEELDAEISATLRAIKNKDPRIYDKDAKFFHSVDENAAPTKNKKEKTMFLHDYHRERYMAGDTGADEDRADAPMTFVQEQADLKKDILAEINAAADENSDDEDGFIKAKAGAAATKSSVHPSRQERIKPKDLDVSLADKDPELFLSNFMDSRAWVPEDGSKWEAFESDDGEGNDDADEWEAAYNLRFEDPAKSNEVLMSYSRKVVEARSVRREEPKGRKRQRELEKERKEEERRQRQEERARLKRLKVEEAEEKLKKIKKAAGLKGKELKDDEWMKLLEGAWEDGKWEEEMNRRFGEQYYAEAEEGSESEDEAGDGKSQKKKKPKKPKWDDDIDIKDIIPDFEDEKTKPDIPLSDSEAEAQAAEDSEDQDADHDPDEDRPSKKRKTAKDRRSERQTAKLAARQERSKIEALVDAQMELDDPTILSTSRRNKKEANAPAAGFRYRETSPQSFGLTTRDILLAPSDAALNEFAGLKKLATFRDAEKKKKDKKRLGKKARLREWRREVFGREFEHTGPTFGFAGERDTEAGGKANEKAREVEAAAASSDNKKKKRKRSKGKKKDVAA